MCSTGCIHLTRNRCCHVRWYHEKEHEMGCLAYKMFVSLFYIIENNTLYACPLFDELCIFPPLNRCIARESGLRLVCDDLPEENYSALGVTRPPRPKPDILDTYNPIESVVPTGVGYKNMDLLHRESKFSNMRSGSAAIQATLQRSTKCFCLLQDVQWDGMEI